MFNKLFEHIIENSLEDFDIGDRVIVRSNEPDPLMIGEYLGDQESGGGSLIPLVRSESDKKTYLVLGIIRKYSDELMAELEGMNPKEQWNHLCHPHMKYELDGEEKKHPRPSNQ